MSFFCLDELQNDEHLEKDYDISREVQDPIEDLEKLKSHPGGAISYETIKKERSLVGFTSTNDITINGITFYINPHFAETKKVFFKIGNEPKNDREKEHGEIDILTNKEYIEVKTGNFVDKPNGFSGKDVEKMEKYRDYVNGKPKIFDKNGNLIDLSNKILVLQIDQNKISPMVLAQMRKLSSPHILRFANGSEIKISEVPFEGKYRKPTTFKGMQKVGTLKEYKEII